MCAACCPSGAGGAFVVVGAGFWVDGTGFLATGFFFSTKALAAGLLLRTGAGPPAFGVVEFGPDGVVGAAELLMVMAVTGRWPRAQLSKQVRRGRRFDLAR